MSALETFDPDRKGGPSEERFRNVSARMSRTLGAADETSLGPAAATVLEDMARWAGADCGFGVLVDEAGRVTDEWHWIRPGFEILAPALGAPLVDTFGSALEFLKVGQTMAVPDLDLIELSPDERRLARRNDLRALAVAPVRVAGVFLGVVGLQVYGQPRTWEPLIVNRLELVAAVLVQTVVRTRQRGAIEQANARARRVARFVPSPLVMLNRTGLVTWVSPSYSTTTGRRADEVVGGPAAGLFVPEDRGLLVGLGSPGTISARLLGADGGWRWTELWWQPIDDDQDGGGEDEGVLELRDIHDRQLQVDELRHDADHDPLTGALNLAGLGRRLELWAAEDRTVMTAFCDLNGFKHWNDTRGHRAGDRLLCAVAVGLTAAVRAGDLVARVGGDEFVVVVVDPSAQDRNALAARLEAAVEGLAESGRVGVSLAVGVSDPGLAGEADVQRLQADDAMYRRKRWQRQGFGARTAGY